MLNRLLTLTLVLSLQFAPAICKGSTPEPEAAVPPCHAHVIDSQSSERPAPEGDSECCAACDAYISSKAGVDVPLQITWLAVVLVPELRAPEGCGPAASVHPPPDSSTSPYSRNNAPLLI